MWKVSREKFQKLVNDAISSLPKDKIDNLKNVAILVEDYPSAEQRTELKLRGDQTLLGLYEGVPLSQRQGQTKILPDKITLFQNPLEWKSDSEKGLLEEIRHTLWHEIAHYYGLDHDAIAKLE